LRSRQPGAESGEQGLGHDGEHDVEVDVEVDGGGKRAGAEGPDDLGEALLDDHPPGIPLDQFLCGGLVLVGTNPSRGSSHGDAASAVPPTRIGTSSPPPTRPGQLLPDAAGWTGE